MPTPLRAIDEFVTEQMTLAKMPGLGLVIVTNVGTVLERGYGYADVERKRPMTVQTPVVLGSTTKALTAAAILQLAERGALHLDDPVQRYVTAFSLADHDSAAHITIRHVLTHTAGLPPTPMNSPTFLFCDDMDSQVQSRFLAELATVEPVWTPGQDWLYSNDGYVLAGLVIEAVTHRSVEAYLEEHVFRVMDLQNTRFPRSNDPVPDIATAYDYGPDGQAFASFFPHNRLSNAAGMLVSSTRDVGHWLQTILGGGQREGRRLLPAARVAEMIAPQARTTRAAVLAGGGESQYGLGWMVRDVGGSRIISHGGSAITMGSHVALMPAERLGVGVVANSSTEATAVITEGVLRLMNSEVPLRSFPRVDWSFQPDPSYWRRLAGTYQPLIPQNMVTSLLPIDITERGLRASTFPGDQVRRPGDIHFVPIDDQLHFILFGRGKTGASAHFSLEGHSIHATIQGAPLMKVASRLHGGQVVLWRE